MTVGDRRGPRAEINMTPMIDVLLVLIIIFMVITPLTPKGLPSLVPQPNGPSRPTPSRNEAVVIEIASNRSVSINAQPVDNADLGMRLTQIYAARGDRTVFVKGAPDLDFRDVARVIDIARGVQIERVGLITAPME